MHGDIPRPKVTHAHLPEIKHSHPERKGILVIGDIHGCCEELLLLHEKAVVENDGKEFACVISVGDLCNKGPASIPVIRHFSSQQQQQQWLAVRGNHDDGAFRAALGDPSQRGKQKYQWTRHLSDEDILWMAEVPYTLRIPGPVLSEEVDTLIVHAGLIPGIDLENQTIETMITVRDVVYDETLGTYQNSRFDSSSGKAAVPWASVWPGPERILFGHDARRELQQYEWATGIDTGVCYGKKLTGLILPQRKLVQVDAVRVHCPFGRID
jgi:Calcineurin-like phosphoesterase